MFSTEQKTFCLIFRICQLSQFTLIALSFVTLRRNFYYRCGSNGRGSCQNLSDGPSNNRLAVWSFGGKIARGSWNSWPQYNIVAFTRMRDRCKKRGWPGKSETVIKVRCFIVLVIFFYHVSFCLISFSFSSKLFRTYLYPGIGHLNTQNPQQFYKNILSPLHLKNRSVWDEYYKTPV